MVDEYIVRTAILDPAISVVRAGARLRSETSWLDSWHCFSYGRHYEPDNTHHGLLLVCNDDRVRGSTGFSEHRHEEMEIVTWMVDGELEHRDASGAHVLRPGVVRRLSAGWGIRHAEMNPAGWAPARYVEMWVPPDTGGLEPGLELADVSGTLAGGESVPLPDGPHVHLFVVLGGGVLDTGGLAGAGGLLEGDSVRLVAAGCPTFTADTATGAEILVWETA